MLSSIIGLTTFLGAAADFWWHLHGLPEDVMSNPHLILFGGAFANLLWLWFMKTKLRGFSHIRMSWFGTILFLAAFAVDVVSHFVWGFEMGVESVYSLSHLGVVIAIIGINYSWAKSSADWAASQRKEKFTLFLPATIGYTGAISMALLLLVIAMPQHSPFSSNLYRPPIIDELGAVMTVTGYWIPNQPANSGFIYFDSLFYLLQVTGTLSIMAFSAILVGVIMRVNREVRLPTGSVFIIVAIGTSVLSLGNDHFEFLAAGWIAAFLFDLGLDLAWERRRSQLLVASIIPPAYFVIYFYTIASREGVWWGLPQVLGCIGWSGFIGFLVAWVVGDLRIREGYRGIYNLPPRES